MTMSPGPWTTSAPASRYFTTSSDPSTPRPAARLSDVEAFLAACEYARGVLPRLRTGVASHDAQDEALTQRINEALTGDPILQFRCAHSLGLEVTRIKKDRPKRQTATATPA
jgi:hypothetical protein